MSDENKKDEQENKEQKKGSKVLFSSIDVDQEDSALTKSEQPLSLVIQKALGNLKSKPAPRIGFTEDPQNTDGYAGIFKRKKGLLPDSVLKAVRVQNHLVASILRARSNTVSMFGRIKKDRFDIGIEVAIKPEFESHITPEQMVKIKDRIERFKKDLVNCGKTDGLPDNERMSLSEFFYLQSQDGLSLGRFATEIIKDDNQKFHRFRPVDAGTIYKTVKKGDAASSLRASGVRLLEQATGTKINIDNLERDEYAYVQTINDYPKQAFSPEEMVVHNLYPSNDIDHNGYPITPIDTCIQSIATHLSIDAYNKLYFQNGRAAKGILVVKSEEIDQNTLNQLKQDFMASINNVGNSFRVPVFGVSPTDEVEWHTMVSSAGDGEFQFLYDSVARNILSTFSMSPDELPGYGHLSRGTNQQTLSECFPLGNMILTRDGLISAEDLLADGKEKRIEVWTGDHWEKARIFLTGNKELRETILMSNLKIQTSPDHRFQVLDENGELTWKQQKDLTLDDVVLVNSKPVAGQESNVPVLLGKPLSEDMMEVLGWMSGDGSVRPAQKRIGGQVSLYYHHDKELDIRDRHLKILNEFGIDANPENKHFSEEEAAAIADRYGFNSVSTLRTNIKIYSTELTNWLQDKKFILNGTKSIPSFVHSLPVGHRQAFLRGLFSADGHASENGSIILTIQEDKAREGVRQLLVGLGIRTTSMDGSNRMSFGEKSFSYKLSIKDRNLFWQQIGFLQKHKQERQKEQLWIISEFPKHIVSVLAKKILESKSDNLSKIDSDALLAAVKQKTSLSKGRILELAQKAHVKLPDWVENFHVEKVKEIKNLEETVEMADIEVFNDEHAFMMHGIRVHNSSNEFKLTAARDTGLRPLILQFQSFLNDKIFPIMDPELHQLCNLSLSGLDAQTREQEALRLQQEMPIYMDYDEVLTQVDKDPLGSRMGGTFPFNERYQVAIDKYLNVSDIVSEFTKSPTAPVDPLLMYKRDPFFIQNMTLLMQINPAAVKAYYATKPHQFEVLKMLIGDYLDEDMEE